MAKPILCPCNSAKNYSQCCGVYHLQPGTAPTAEALMRSRYSAFALNNIDYIQATQQLSEPEHDADTQAIEAENSQTQWLQLEIVDTEQGTQTDSTGTVTFNAKFKEGIHQGELSEKSLFSKIDGQWFYVSGSHDVKTSTQTSTPAQSTKVGRNDPCSCGSGKKAKKCCA